ncbi:MAG: efflux RND transporter permease subunit [Nitritalea sp.]
MSAHFLRPQAYRLALLALGISLLFVALRPTPVFNYDFEGFFPRGDESLRYYQDFRERFQNDNDYLLIAVQAPETVWDRDFLAEVEALQEELRALPAVEAVQSALDLEELRAGSFGLSRRKYIQYEDEEALEASQKRLEALQTTGAQFIAAEERYLLLLLENEQEIAKERGDTLFQAIQATLNARAEAFSDIKTAGKIKAQGAFVSLLQAEFAFFLGMSFLLIICLLALLFQTWWGVVLPLLVLAVGIAWSLAFRLLSGQALDVLAVMQPTLLLVIGLSACVHYLSYYLLLLRRGYSKWEAIPETFRHLFLAVFLTALTTSLGFFSLYLASADSIRYFGLFTGAGVLFMFIAINLLLPALLYRFAPEGQGGSIRGHQRWERGLRGLMGAVLRNRKTVLATFMFLVAASLALLPRLQVDGYLLDNLPEDHPIVQEFLFFDRTFGGSNPLEISITAGSEVKNLWDYRALKALDTLEQFIQKTYATGPLLSPLSYAKFAHMASNQASPKAFVLPSEARYARYDGLIEGLVEADFLPPLLDPSETEARITGRMQDWGSARASQRDAELRAFTEAHIPEEILLVRRTGTSYLIDKSHRLVSEQMAKGLGLAFLLVAAVAGILFRSWRMAFLVLIPNVIPLLFMCSVMVLLGIDLKLTTAILFAVAFGIAVDDSIHFMSKLYGELRDGKSMAYAVKRTFLETGKAISLSTLILCSGFALLLFSAFGVTFYTGLLISLALLFAWAADLLLLPVLLGNRSYGVSERLRKRAPMG